MPLRFERPIIGYAGKLGLRIDVSLILRLADTLRSGNIVLAGPTMSPRWIRPLLSHPRVRLVGDLHYSLLPDFLAAIDVGIVPHRVGAMENSGDPTKVYEYLAAGRPVISTAIGGIERFADRVVIGRTNDEFIDGVLAAADGKPSRHGPLYPNETWEARVDLLMRHFQINRAERSVATPAGDPAREAMEPRYSG